MTKNFPPGAISSTPPYNYVQKRKDKGLRDIGLSMNIENLILGVNSVTVSYLIHYDSLLQNATGFLLQNVTVLLQNARVITKCDVYYKFWQCIYPSLLGQQSFSPIFVY